MSLRGLREHFDISIDNSQTQLTQLTGHLMADTQATGAPESATRVWLGYRELLRSPRFADTLKKTLARE